jgi:hypothetical protein
MSSNEKNKLQIIQPWSVPVVKTNLPPSVLETMIELTDLIADDQESVNHGKHLAGQIDTELIIDEELLRMTGILDFFLESIRQFIIVCKCQSDPAKSKQIQQEEWLNRITKMWMISQKPNEYNPLHFHENCDISAVMYLKVPKMLLHRKEHGADGYIQFSGNVARDTKFSIPSLTIPPQVGEFYIFGAHQQHAVYPFRCEERQEDVERRSVSFNAIIKDD